MEHTFEGIIAVAAGATSVAIATFNMPKPPIVARGDIMKKGSGASNIFVTADYGTFNYQGGTFYFDAPIPSDGNTYLLYFTFKTGL